MLRSAAEVEMKTPLGDLLCCACLSVGCGLCAGGCSHVAVVFVDVKESG